MREFTKCAAQGDVLFVRVDSMPDGLSEQVADDGALVVTHSETGHSHVMVVDKPQDPPVQMFNGDNPLLSWIKVNRSTSLDHLRDHHTHESIMFEPGMYEIRRQREETPEGWRRAAD